MEGTDEILSDNRNYEPDPHIFGPVLNLKIFWTHQTTLTPTGPITERH